MATLRCLQCLHQLTSAWLLATLRCHPRGPPMRWHDVAANFFGGVFLANFVPHFVAGVSGRSFYSPFAKPPFRGLSTPAVNVLWGLFNLAVAYALLVVVGDFELRRLAHAA